MGICPKEYCGRSVSKFIGIAATGRYVGVVMVDLSMKCFVSRNGWNMKIFDHQVSVLVFLAGHF